MKHVKHTWTMAVATALLAGGPTGSARAGEAPAGQGIWRAAYVVQGIDAKAPHPLVAASRDCRAQAGAISDATQWVVLRYRRVPGDVYMVAPVAPGLTLKPGQSVDLDVQACRPVAQVRGATGAAQG
ncbi:MAG: hypothetical protein QM749_17055 [Aquabacterium sp.]